MVRSLQLTTRCAANMAAAGGTLSGLLHRRQYTLPPSLLPHRPPNSECPWTLLTLPPNPQTPQKLTYRDVLRNPPTKEQMEKSSPPIQPPSPKSHTQPTHDRLCETPLTRKLEMAITCPLPRSSSTNCCNIPQHCPRHKPHPFRPL